MNSFKCSNCGGDVPQGMKFCPHCMTQFEEKTQIEYVGKNKKPYFITAFICLFILTGFIAFSAFETHDKEKSDSQNNNISTESYNSDDTSNNISQNSFVEKLINSINENECEYFTIYDINSIRYNETNGQISLSFTDNYNAEVSVETDKTLSNAKINVTIHDTSESIHIKEAFDCLGEVLFNAKIGDKVSSKNSDFSENGYTFSLLTMNTMSGYYSCEYHLTATRN